MTMEVLSMEEICTDQFRDDLAKSCANIISQLSLIDVSQFYFQVRNWEFGGETPTAIMMILSKPVEEIESVQPIFENLKYSQDGTLTYENIKDDIHIFVEQMIRESINIRSDMKETYVIIQFVLNDFGENSYANQIRVAIDNIVAMIVERIKMEDVRQIVKNSFKDFFKNTMKDSIRPFLHSMPREELSRMIDGAIDELQISAILNS